MTSQPRPIATRSPVAIVINWRDENYGRISGALAFRPTVAPFPSDTMAARIVRIYRRHGFAMHPGRDSYVNQQPTADTPAQLAAALTAAGFIVTHAGCVPPSIAQIQE
ncbi:hypothetical protein ABMY26_07245 (plasmid) [Azospirillum sp. HJ39]|uniref:hypothetical protein n=1 Tax=Azospirillum sp. HJ39 TaxID=3159496 RepID=UPI003558678F